jgi:GTP diphosphokinase / guanosine-3',5'-bis(diphosphate) 3'-diphosphatase
MERFAHSGVADKGHQDTPVEELIETIIDQVQTRHPQANLEMMRRAFDFAAAAHKDQLRLTGDPYITHPVAVARILAELGMDDATVTAALLHDVVEDTPVTLAEIREKFSDEIAQLVDGVTKIGQIDFAPTKLRAAENLRRMLLAMARDLRVIIIKLADRLHNMRTLKPLPPERRKAVAEETLQIFSPIAHRLGLWRFKWELDDLALRHIEPATYRRIVHLVAKTRTEREERIRTAMELLSSRLAESGIKAEVVGRPKHLYSIYQKMKSQGVDFNQILDIEAIRVIVGTVQDCYTALGVVHSLWLPMPDMFTDYIAKPKPNMYRSLHTKVLGPTGDPMEVQIRTAEMHRTAEYGVAAHWLYKEGAASQAADEKLAWVRRLIDMHTDFADPGEWLETLRLDLFKDQVFVFTPHGDVIDLTAGSTPVDFAYRIHTEVGNSCVGAKVNGKMVALNYVFKNGDVVEILTAKTARGPSLDWLSFVATSAAKSRIKAWYRRLRRDENIIHGRHLLEAECKREGITPADIISEEALTDIAAKMNMASFEDLLAAVGFGEISAEAIIRRLGGRPHVAAPAHTPAPSHQGALRLGVSASAPGSEGILFRLSRCCCPVPGDEIAGYITRGRGVAVHRADCRNLAAYRASEPERIMSVEWSLSQEAFYPVSIEIEALDRVGLLNDITNIISITDTNIRSARMTTKKPRLALVSLVVDISGIDQLDRLMKDISSLSDVLRVYRQRNA